MNSQIVGTLKQALWDFYTEKGLLRTASLAYYAILSFVPILFLLLSIAGFFFGESQWLQGFIQNNLNILPWAKDFLLKQVHNLEKSAPHFSLVCIFFIIWTSGMFFSALQASLNLILCPEKKQTNLFRLILPWLMSPILGTLIILSMLAIHIWGYIPEHILPGHLTPGIWTWLIFSGLILFLYQLFSRHRPSFWTSLGVSCAIGILSQLVTKFFSFVLWGNPEYGLVYGTLSSVVIFLLWLNYNMVLILLGAYYLKNWDLNILYSS